MFKPLYDFGKQLVNLARDTQKNSADIKELQRQLEGLTDRVVRLAFDLDRYRESDSKEREMQVLRLENALLRFERRLPPPPPNEHPGF